MIQLPASMVQGDPGAGTAWCRVIQGPASMVQGDPGAPFPGLSTSPPPITPVARPPAPRRPPPPCSPSSPPTPPAPQAPAIVIATPEFVSVDKLDCAQGPSTGAEGAACAGRPERE